MHETLPQLILASASSARRQLLINAGITPVIQPSQFDESQIVESDPRLLVQELAQRKAEVVAEQYRAEGSGVSGASNPLPLRPLVLGCDSVLVIHGDIHGKPASEEEAIARWQRMRGHAGELVTGHALIDVGQQRTLVEHQSTQVKFALVSDRQIRAYVATGEPMHCAGCFTLEGQGSPFIEAITGCYTNVLGLSMPLLRQMLDTLGHDITDLWTHSTP